MTNVTIRLEGKAAIEAAMRLDLLLCKHADPIEDGRVGLSPYEAREVARRDPSLIYLNLPAVFVYRRANPLSRATHDVTEAGSTGTTRRATCIYCRQVVATWSGKYPKTQTAKLAIEEHSRVCAHEYLRTELARLGVARTEGA